MAGFAIRDEMNGIEEAPNKVWFWELDEAVIEADRCIQCGACIAACPSDSIGIGKDGLPALVKMCTGCSLCWDFCPRAGLRHEATWSLLAPAETTNGHAGNGHTTNGHGGNGHAADGHVSNGHAAHGHSDDGGDVTWKVTGTAAPRTADSDPLEWVTERYTARVRPRIQGAQDGGVVSAMLIALLEAGDIDGALVARESASARWKAEPFLARTPEEIRASAGSFYNQTLALGHLDLKGYDLPPNPRIALVGTPCEVEAIQAMQARPWTWGASKVEAVVLTIALLCTKSFNYEKLMVEDLQQRRGLDLDRIGKVDVLHGKLIVEDTEGTEILREPIRDFHGAALKGCDECTDFLGSAADVSVGSVGSADGYSSVLIRTTAGSRAFDRVRGRLEVRDLDSETPLRKLDALDKKIAFRSMPRPFDPSAPLFIDYETHLRHYQDSDRAPVGRA